MGCTVTYNVNEAIAQADIINLLRIQHERQRKTMFPSLGEYTSLFGLTKARLTLAKPEALIMHPGPINRGVEIDSEIADSLRSLIIKQVTNGLAVRMAVLFLVSGGHWKPCARHRASFSTSVIILAATASHVSWAGCSNGRRSAPSVLLRTDRVTGL